MSRKKKLILTAIAVVVPFGLAAVGLYSLYAARKGAKAGRPE